MSDPSKPDDHPSQEDFILLLQDLRRRIGRLLQNDERAPDTESPLLREAVLALTQRRRRDRDRGQAPLDGMEKPDDRPEPESSSPQEPGDDEEPPS